MVDAGIGRLQVLPPEIREKIFKYLLVEDEPILIKRSIHPGQNHAQKASRTVDIPKRRRTHTRGTVTWDGAQSRTISILLVRRSIKKEALNVLYGYNRFAFENALGLENFLDSIGDSTSYLRHIMMNGNLFVFGTSYWKSMDRSLNHLTWP